MKVLWLTHIFKMYHYFFTWETNIKRGDFLFHRNSWKEIRLVSDDSGILLDGSWICRSKLHYDKVEPSYEI